MIRKTTIEKLNNLVNSIEKSGLSINAYFNSEGKSPSYFYSLMCKLKQESITPENELYDIVNNIILKYNSLKYRGAEIDNLYNEGAELIIPGLQLEAEHTEEVQDTDDKIESSFVRNSEGKIVGYSFKVYRRDKTPVQGTLTRDEMQTIYRLYSYYGASITQREVSRHFPDYSLQDFKRILRAFNITKASGPFAPHMYEEKTEEELKEYHLREKENDFLKKIEKDELNDIRHTAVKLARENRELQAQLESLDTIKVDLTGFTPSPKAELSTNSEERTIVLFLSDMHIGAKCNSYTLYENDWNREELKERLDNTITRVSKIGPYYKIVLCLLGDNLDGMDGQTARRDHIMPQNMDNMEQIETFLEVMVPFIDNLRTCCEHLEIYSVKEGNHDGITGYVATLALKNLVNNYYKEVPFTLFKEFIGSFKVFDHTYCICHGKDSMFMKRPMPLVLDERTKVMIYEWMEDNNIKMGSKTHFVKGDLHSNALSSCNLFDYRNVLSLFGASDYSNFNYSRNAHGISYDLFINNVRTSGTFENV